MSDKKTHYPVLSGLVKIAYPEPEYTFNVVLPDGETTRQVQQDAAYAHCQSVRTLRIRLALFIVLIIWNNRGLLWMIYAYLVLVPVRIRYMYVSQWLNGPNVGIYEQMQKLIYESWFGS